MKSEQKLSSDLSELWTNCYQSLTFFDKVYKFVIEHLKYLLLAICYWSFGGWGEAKIVRSAECGVTNRKIWRSGN
jgi:hypothetical protein